MLRFTGFGVIKIRLFTICIWGYLTCLCLMLSACGFHLQGQQPYRLSENKTHLPVLIDAQTSKSAYTLRLSLLKQLTRYDMNAHIDTHTSNSNDHSTLDSLGTANRIIIDDVSIQKYQLAGLLTEVRLTMTAKVRYQIQNKDNTTTTLNRILMVERSYQYNQTSVSVEDLQRIQTEGDLYDAMAQRISDQYHALLNTAT